MITDYYIRIATQEDVHQMQSILSTASRDWSASTLISCFGKGYKQWAICFQSTMLGFVIIKTFVDHWEIMQLVVGLEYQRQGLAARLLKFAIDEARKSRAHRIQLEVRRSNHPAILLYHSLGFHEAGVRSKYYSDGEDALLMDYDL